MKEWEIQQSIYTELSTFQPLTEKVSGVFDKVPQKRSYPYVVIGDDTAVEFDTADYNGVNATITIHIWSRYPGRKECKEIMGIIYGALHHANISITGLDVITCFWEFSETILDSDGETRHGITRYRIIAQEAKS